MNTTSGVGTSSITDPLFVFLIAAYPKGNIALT